MKLTYAQRRALWSLSNVELGWVHAATAMTLVKAGLIERHPTSRITNWWSITPAGRAALRSMEEG